MRREPRRISFIWIAIAFEAGLGVLACLLAWLFDEPFWNAIYWEARDTAIGIAACLPMLLIFWLCLRWPVGPLLRIKTITEQFIRPLFVGCTWIELAGLSLVAGIGEELLFRGVVQLALSRWWGPWLGVTVASLLFGLLHAITATYVLLAALLGAYLGGLCLATGNLLTAMLAHAFYDFLALLYLVHLPPALAEGNPPLAGANASKQ